MKKIYFLISLFLICNILILAQYDPQDSCPSPSESSDKASGPLGGKYKPSSNGINEYFRILIVFAQFSDDNVEDSNWPLDELPIYADNLLIQNPSSSYPAGTLSDYWDKMSHSNFDIIGTVYPELVMLPSAASYQQAGKKVDHVNQDVINLIDPYVNFSLYDNWKLQNGVFVFSPGNSDGYVDMIFICYRFPESWFAPHYAWAHLGWYFQWTFSTEDFNSQGVNIKVKGETGMSATSSGLTLRHALRDEYSIKQTMIHEFGHFLIGGCHTTTGGIMGIGASNDCRTFALSGWESQRLGYNVYSVANQNGYTKTLGDYLTTGDVLKIPIPFNNPNSSTFFVVENHQRLSMYDQIMRGGALNGAWNFTTTLGKGIYIHYITFGSSQCCSNDWRAADGSWNWVLNGTIQMDPNSWPATMPLTKRNAVNRNTGKSDRHHENISWNNATWSKWHDEDLTGNYILTRDIMGDEKDAWNIGYNEIFSRWSNPSTYSSTVTNGIPNITVQLHSQNGSNITVKVFSTEASGIALAPSKPQFLKVTTSANLHPYLTWEFNTETDISGYRVYKWNTLTLSWQLLATRHSNQNYYEDVTEDYCPQGQQCQSGHYVYYTVTSRDNQSLESVRADSVKTFVLGGAPDKIVVSHLQEIIPDEYSLEQNYPNPFNPETKIRFAIKESGLVLLKVFDVLGTEVMDLVNETKPAGIFEVEFDASNLPSGVYIYSLQVNGFVSNQKMILLK